MAKIAVFFIGTLLAAAMVAMGQNTHNPDRQKNGGSENTDDDAQREWPYNGVTIGKRAPGSRFFLNGYPSEELTFEEHNFPEGLPWQWFVDSQVMIRLFAKLLASVVTEQSPQPAVIGNRRQWQRPGEDFHSGGRNELELMASSDGDRAQLVARKLREFTNKICDKFFYSCHRLA